MPTRLSLTVCSGRSGSCIAFLVLVGLASGAALPRSNAQSVAAEIDFVNDLIPVFTKLGCNAGACHGAAAGRGGMRLSLFGSDPAADYRAIVRELEGRRVNLARPAHSLIVRKPSEDLAHGGGQLIEERDPSYRSLLDWIAQGARYTFKKQLHRIGVNPSRVVAEVNAIVPIKISAEYGDNSFQDVTRWTVLTPEDPTAVSVSADSGSMRVLRRGRHIVVARYLTEVVPIEVLVPLGEPQSETSLAAAPVHPIDQEVYKTLETLHLPRSVRVDDTGFRRRATLHLTGRLPELVSEQTSSEAPLDRVGLVDELLNSPEFVEYWTLQMSKLLRLRGQPNDVAGAQTYFAWLQEQVRRSTGYDEIARTLLLAEGDSHQFGPANFFRTSSGPREQAEFVSELFMATRLRCANCHNHPLDRWTQDDYHGLAAIFAKVEIGQVVRVKASGEVIHPTTQEPAQERIPGGVFLPEGAVDGRLQFAQWLIARDNPYFAKAFVNRLWRHLMGRGLVEPVDDFRSTNPATHPELLDKLATEFVASQYDVRRMLRWIMSSETYSVSGQAEAGSENDDRFYSHALSTPLEPEVLADAISDVLGLSEAYGNLPLGTRAVTLIDPKTPSMSLDVLGRCDREAGCDMEGQDSAGLTQKLHFLNGELLNGRILAPGSRLEKLLNAGASPEIIISVFYQLALSRRPNATELSFWQDSLEANVADLRNADRKSLEREFLEDFVWSLLSCEEFTTNH
jgi:hypothetical protein